jgi:hypothetical protein
MKKIVVGYGTGRCGTKSLAEFLDQQDGFNVTHEKVGIHWEMALNDPIDTVDNMLRDRPEKIVGDVTFAWIKWLWLILGRYQGSKAINLVRPLDDVIESFWNFKKNVTDDNHFRPGETWLAYPFNSFRPTKDEMVRTLKMYRLLEASVRKTYPHSIFVLEMEELNDPSVLQQMLEWLDFGQEEYILDTVHTHKQSEVVHKILHPERRKPPWLSPPQCGTKENRILRAFRRIIDGSTKILKRNV